MALIQEIKSRFGINTRYWKVVTVEINLLNKNCRIVLQGWVSKESRFKGDDPIDCRIYEWSDLPLDSFSNILKAIYSKIRNYVSNDNGTNEFSTATDDTSE